MAKIWLAAHWDKKLTKAHIFETDIEGSVEAIIQPKVKLALRTSGHLLLGVVRIYSRKAKYLLADCNEALVKIKMAFRPGMVDLPEENCEAAVSAITLPENFYDFENMMVDLAEFELPSHCNVNQSRPEEITMQEVVQEGSYIGDDGFGDIGYDSLELSDIRLDDPFYIQSEKHLPEMDIEGIGSNGLMDLDDGEIAPVEMDRVHEEMMDVAESQTLTSGVPLPATEPLADDLSDYEGPAGVEDDIDSDVEPMGVEEGRGPDDMAVDKSKGLFEEPESVVEPVTLLPHNDDQPNGINAYIYDHQDLEPSALPEQTALVGVDQTTLISNEAEAFPLMPIDVSSFGTKTKAKKKRRLIVDEVKAISSEAMKTQLANGVDLVIPLDLAPPTKKLMQWKESGGVERLMILPGRLLLHKQHSQHYSVNLITRPCTEEDEEESKESKNRKELEKSVEVTSQKQKKADSFERADETEGLPTVELPRANLSGLDEDSLVGNIQSYRRSSAEDTTLTTSALAHHLEDSLPSAPTEDLVVPGPEHRLPSLPLAEMLVGDVTLPHVEGAVEPPVTPRPGAAEYLSMSIMEPRSHFSEWAAGGDDDLDESAFNENAVLNIRSKEAVGILDGDELQMEEQRLSNRRSTQLLQTLGRILCTDDSVGMKRLLSRNNRKQVASKFYTILVLKKLQAINVHQDEPYADIVITKGPKFDALH